MRDLALFELVRRMVVKRETDGNHYVCPACDKANDFHDDDCPWPAIETLVSTGSENA
jgi:hypothetical protein